METKRIRNFFADGDAIIQMSPAQVARRKQLKDAEDREEFERDRHADMVREARLDYERR